MAKTSMKKASFGTSMGVSSIIAILVILVLVVFSTLSITTSKADLTLSQKSSESIKAYYQADAAAEDRIAEVAEFIENDGDNWQKGLEQKDYYVSKDKENTLVSYVVPIDENRNLNVELRVSKDGSIVRDLWQVVPAKEWVPDNSINLFQP